MRQFGKQPPKYRFFLNPYEDARFTRCPQCREKTRQRKVPLLIHVDPKNPVALNKTCRYCPECDLLIAHQDEVESQLALIFQQRDPDLIGNDYLTLGTFDRAVWKRGLTETLGIEDMIENLHDFKEVVTFEPAHYGWIPDESARSDES